MVSLDSSEVTKPCRPLEAAGHRLPRKRRPTDTTGAVPSWLMPGIAPQAIPRTSTADRFVLVPGVTVRGTAASRLPYS